MPAITSGIKDTAEIRALCPAVKPIILYDERPNAIAPIMAT